MVYLVAMDRVDIKLRHWHPLSHQILQPCIVVRCWAGRGRDNRRALHELHYRCLRILVGLEWLVGVVLDALPHALVCLRLRRVVVPAGRQRHLLRPGPALLPRQWRVVRVDLWGLVVQLWLCVAPGFAALQQPWTVVQWRDLPG